MTPPTTVYRGYVYLIGSRKFGWFKIGKSRSAEFRIRDIGILLPFKIEVICVWAVENPNADETEMHIKYADRHLNGEWFSFTRLILLSVMENGPKNSRLVFPSARQNNFFLSFSNIGKDKVVDHWQEEKEYMSKLFRDTMKAYVRDNGLEDSPENRRLARKYVLETFTFVNSERDTISSETKVEQKV